MKYYAGVEEGAAVTGFGAGVEAAGAVLEVPDGAVDVAGVVAAEGAVGAVGALVGAGAFL